MPRFDFDSLTDFGDNIGATATHSIYSFQPTLTLDRQPLAARRLRRAAVSRIRLRAGTRRRPIRFPVQLHARARQFGRALRPGCGQLPARHSDRRLARHQRRAPERHVVPRRSHPGRLEDHRSTDAEPGSALRIRGADHRLRIGTCASFDPTATVSIEGRRARPTRPTRFRRFRRRNSRSAAGSSLPPTATSASTTPMPTTFSRAWVSPARCRTRPCARRCRRLRDTEHHPRQLSARLLLVTAIVPTLDNGLTFRANLRNLFPDGVAAPVARRWRQHVPRTIADRTTWRSTGASTSRFVTRYIFSVQRELPGQWVLEAAYAGSRGWDLTTGGGGQAGEIELNGVPAQYLSTSRVRDQATIS